MWCGNVRFGELLIEDSTYLGDQKRLPRGSDVWVEPSREKRGKLESSSKATSWCEAQTEIWNVRRVPVGDEEDHWVWEPCGVSVPSWKPGGATGGYYASEVWDLVTEGPTVSSPTALGDGSGHPLGTLTPVRAWHTAPCPETGSQGSVPVPEALSLAGILPFPRGDHSHAGWDYQQPQGVESACWWVWDQDEGAGGGEAETAGSQPRFVEGGGWGGPNPTHTGCSRPQSLTHVGPFRPLHNPIAPILHMRAQRHAEVKCRGQITPLAVAQPGSQDWGSQQRSLPSNPPQLPLTRVGQSPIRKGWM